MKWAGADPKLTPEQAAELKRLVELRRADRVRHGHYTDKFLKAHFGLKGNSLYRYVRDEVKKCRT